MTNTKDQSDKNSSAISLKASLIACMLLVLVPVRTTLAHHNKESSMQERLACAELIDVAARRNCLDLVERRDYQIGSVNGREKVDHALLLKDSSYRKSVLATGRISCETAFYIGRFAGEHVAVTSMHVVTGANPRINCSCWEIQFEYLLPANSVHCDRIIAAWPELDLALISLEVPSADDGRLLEKNALRFDFTSRIRHGQKLVLAGYGGFGNVGHTDLMINRDSDCMVMSADATYRLRQVHAPKKGVGGVWSVAIGCDSSPGDSGSAVLDRMSGRVLGVLWGGDTGKPDWVRDSALLHSTLATGREEAVWQYLNYATPAVKIREIIDGDLRSNQFDKKTATILRAWLAK